MTTVDLNFDGGEGFDDEALARHVTTIHVACGGHAGDDASMRRSLELARRWGLAVGAHPGYPDRARFGRVALDLPPEEVRAFVLRQAGRLLELARETGVAVTQLKPHGALYHEAAGRWGIAEAVARAALALDPRLVLVTAPGSKLSEAAAALGLSSSPEAFADRRYRADGTLVPRAEPDALLSTPEEAAAQAASIAVAGEVRARDGSIVRVTARTICLHGDTPGSAANAAAVRDRLRELGVEVSALAQPSFPIASTGHESIAS